MGAWSTEPFGNDEAGDWGYELEETADFSLVERAFDDVLEASYVESHLGSIAVAAAEALAQLLGKGAQAEAPPEAVAAWVQKMAGQSPPAALRTKALSALARALDSNSELNDLWQETEDYDAWKSSVLKLRDALAP